MAEKVRIAAVQLRSGIDPAANRKHAAPFIRAAALDGARLVATPECTTRLDRNSERMLAAIGPEKGDPEITAWSRLAEEHGVWLLLGSTIVASGAGKGLNRSLLFTPGGKIAARYDKIHLFEAALGGGEAYRESNSFDPGCEAVIAEGPLGAKLGLTICYDLRFAPLYGALASANADIIFAPAAFTKPTGEAHWETLIRARAIETGAFMVAPAQGGVHEDGRATWGHSMIVDPWGKVIAGFDHDEPGVLIADLNLDLVQDARAKVPAWRGGRTFTGPK
ncbi:MAG: carbon-nitrogen hydrolase family protein [Caulobacterales bacterium]